jgi:LacI family transcriptional regulator, fructose operon transcriptional repressor
MVSIKDVAEVAGVSTATVSRVLSNKPHVRPELRDRVLEAVSRLNYRPNLVARNLRSQQSRILGLIVSDIRNPYFTDVSRAVEDVAHAEGYSVFLCNTDENPEKERIYLNLMRDENVAGVIFSPTRETAVRFADLQLDFPTVVVDRMVSGGLVDQVLIDNAAAAQELTAHLIANGYRRIAGVFGDASTTGRERQQGFVTALQAHDLAPAQVAYILPKISAGYTAVLGILDGDNPPDAIVATNSLLTAGALKAIRARNLRIPTEVALAGFDETTWTTLVEPPITVIAQPTQEIGRTAAELLLDRIEEPERPPRKVILSGELLVRPSSASRTRT